MQTLEISDKAYKKIMSHRIGAESVSATIIRMAESEGGWDVEKLDADLDKIEKKSKYHSFDEVFKGV